MDNALSTLGPYPFLQLAFGMVILGLGIWSIIKGLQSKPEGKTMEDQRADWEARRQLENIEKNTWEIVALLEKQNELLGRLASVLYNERR